jgi:hypothetical protein
MKSLRDMDSVSWLRGIGIKRSRLYTSAVLLLLAFGALGMSSSLLQRQDPVELIRQKGTAGMKLRDGKTIVVQNGKLYVRSGRSTRPFLPEGTQIAVRHNRSGINSNGIAKIAEEAVKAKFATQYNQSYRIHSDFDLKGQRGNERTVVCHLTFEYRNIWYAEEKTLEIDVVQSGADFTLKNIRTPLVATALPLKTTPQRVGRPAAKPVPAKQLTVARAAEPAKARPSVNTDVTRKVLAKYPTFEALPIHTIIKEFPMAIVPAGPSAKALANTAYPEVVTADEATDQVYTLFLLAFGSAKKLVGPAESGKDNVLNYLRNDGNLIAWNNIGHGNTTKLFQNGTNILHTDISGGAAAFQGLNNCVCLVNACQTFNDPLKAAIIGRAPRTYIAGVINLPKVTSEGSNPNFWFKVLFQGKTMAVAYNETNNQAGLNGYWGFWGDSGVF